MRTFRGRVLNAETAMRQIDSGAPSGELDVVVAVFDIPDTEVAVGNRNKQIIDLGAFDPWIKARERPTYPFFLDHGEAPFTGYYTRTLKVGHVPIETVEETSEGLLIHPKLNLGKQLAREEFLDLLEDPEGAQFSFGWEPDREVIEVKDRVEHAVELWPTEFSSVAFGAQRLAHLVGARAALAERAAIAAHSTATEKGSWDAGANEKALSNDDGSSAYRKAYAWVDPDGDADKKASYKFIHHFVSDGSAGAASTVACSAGIAVLNGGRGGTTIPDEDRQGVYRHMAKHLRDADLEPPELKAAGAGGLDLADFPVEELGEAIARHAFHGDKTPKRPTTSLLKEWLKDDDFLEKVKNLVKGKAVGEQGGETAARGVSVDMLSMEIRGAWYDRPARPREDYSWPQDIWIGDDGLDSGFIVINDRGQHLQVPWSRADDGAYEFDEENAQPVTQEWVKDGSPLRAFLVGEHFHAVLRGDRELADALRAAAEKAVEPDPLWAYYDTRFKGARQILEAQRG